jgi:hypothetical protein
VDLELMPQNLEHIRMGSFSSPAAQFRLPGKSRTCVITEVGATLALMSSATRFNSACQHLAAVEHLHDEVRRQLDHVQGLVDLVGHAGGHDAQGGHLSRLDQLGFFPDGLCDVGGGRNQTSRPPYSARLTLIFKKAAVLFCIGASWKRMDCPSEDTADRPAHPFRPHPQIEQKDLQFVLCVAVVLLGGLIGVQDLKVLGLMMKIGLGSLLKTDRYFSSDFLTCS